MKKDIFKGLIVDFQERVPDTMSSLVPTTRPGLPILG
ncbi:hypothetical protein BMS3Bbin06_02333 [bacterium BMS3Bbin06]|nr:hypothetical protein BMS3Bbin06_02333 [bacterium BMS3Bbin06]